MRSKFLQEIIDETPEDVKIYVRLYADILKRIHQSSLEKEMAQKELNENLPKSVND